MPILISAARFGEFNHNIMVINDATVCKNYSKGQKWASKIECMTGTIDQLTGTIVTISTKTVDFPNIDIKVFNRKSDFPLRNFLRSLTEPEITRKPFKLTYIEYDRIKDEI